MIIAGRQKLRVHGLPLRDLSSPNSNVPACTDAVPMWVFRVPSGHFGLFIIRKLQIINALLLSWFESMPGSQTVLSHSRFNRFLIENNRLPLMAVNRRVKIRILRAEPNFSPPKLDRPVVDAIAPLRHRGISPIKPATSRSSHSPFPAAERRCWPSRAARAPRICPNSPCLWRVPPRG